MITQRMIAPAQPHAYHLVEPREVGEVLGELRPVALAQVGHEIVEAHLAALLRVVGHLSVADLRDHHRERPDVRAGCDLRRWQVHQDLRRRPVDVPAYIIPHCKLEGDRESLTH